MKCKLILTTTSTSPKIPINRWALPFHALFTWVTRYTTGLELDFLSPLSASHAPTAAKTRYQDMTKHYRDMVLAVRVFPAGKTAPSQSRRLVWASRGEVL